jgi:hypothetical protein
MEGGEEKEEDKVGERQRGRRRERVRGNNRLT